LLAIVCALLTTASAPPPPAMDGPITIVATALSLDSEDLARRRVGALRFLNVWKLTSDHPRFGGISAMAIDAGRVTALSDAGNLIRFSLPRRGRIAGATIHALPDGPGDGSRKQDRDTESLMMDRATGRFWVGFEHHNMIWRYAPGATRAEAKAAPKVMADWPKNGGPEAMLRLFDGRVLVFGEEAEEPDGTTAGLIFTGDPADPAARPRSFGYRAPAGYRVTDGAQLPDGRVILLNRHFALIDGISAAVTLIDPATIRPDSVVEGIEIARLAPPLTVDNMEALAVTRERGQTILWMMSDDNFNAVQRTLLLKFRLEESRAR